MLPDARTDNLTLRAAMTAIGAAAGLSVWLFVDVLDDLISDQHLYLLGFAVVAGYFTVLLALTGPARLGPAALAAAVLALPAGGLLTLASLRYDDTRVFFDSPLAFFAMAVILIVGTPFVAAMLQDRSHWRHYPRLFNIAWTITVRYVAGWLFVGLFWAVLMLSDSLLQMVGLTVIEDLLDIDAVPYVLTGLVLGLALAVVHELREYVSPDLILRLLRLLLPAVLVVVAVFIAALPVRGFANLVGEFSPASTLMAMAWAGITLVTTALDKSDSDAVRGGWMRGATQVLALLLPVLAALAVWAVGLRVMQYGWTPPRLAAGLAGMFMLAYGMLYAVAVLLRRNWMERIRQANTAMALLLIAVSALWLTPLIHAERLSAQSQVARIVSGNATPEQAAIWELQRDWGRAGREEAAQLMNMGDLPNQEAFAAALEDAAKATTEMSYVDRALTSGQSTATDRLARVLPVYPPGRALSPSMLLLPPVQVQDWLRACALADDDGQPGCAMVLGDFGSAAADETGVVFLAGPRGRVDAVGVKLSAGELVVTGPLVDETTGQPPELDRETLRRVQAGDFEIAPASRRALWLGAIELVPHN